MSDRATSLYEFSTPASSIRPRPTVVHRLALMVEIWRTRRILAGLDPRLLKDIGVSRGEAQTEVARAPWDIEPR